LDFAIDRITKKCTEKRAKTKFIATWTPIVVIEVGDHFHQKFQENLHVDPHRYKGVNMGYTTWIQTTCKVIGMN
jgi:hypothetical protein